VSSRPLAGRSSKARKTAKLYAFCAEFARLIDRRPPLDRGPEADEVLNGLDKAFGVVHKLGVATTLLGGLVGLPVLPDLVFLGAVWLLEKMLVSSTRELQNASEPVPPGEPMPELM
jgi:hypothetical protein